MQTDIADPIAVECSPAEPRSGLGCIGVLFDDAVIVGPNEPTWECPPDAFGDVVTVGLIGTFHGCQAVIPHMIKANYRGIVSMSSVAGKEDNPRTPAYSATKAAVIALTGSLGKELAAYDIVVSCARPAIAKTTMVLSQAGMSRKWSCRRFRVTASSGRPRPRR